MSSMKGKDKELPFKKGVFADKLQERMKDLGITNYQLSKITGITESQLSKYAMNEHMPCLVNFIIIAKALSVEAYEYFFDEKIKSVKRENIDISEALGINDATIEYIKAYNHEAFEGAYVKIKESSLSWLLDNAIKHDNFLYLLEAIDNYRSSLKASPQRDNIPMLNTDSIINATGNGVIILSPSEGIRYFELAISQLFLELIKECEDDELEEYRGYI